ncbi:hypothetical protein TSUD_216440 [Trifolium subterraneum]|uniref:Uncharacterized protein n=1 Tax=Trifolium subterraneum TaxID=3900 RepID=A0A2Z6LZW7_TRISU|nr:hypothetical protein TSUD_216440 [Trifolium subterraneum]
MVRTGENAKKQRTRVGKMRLSVGRAWRRVRRRSAAVLGRLCSPERDECSGGLGFQIGLRVATIKR